MKRSSILFVFLALSLSVLACNLGGNLPKKQPENTSAPQSTAIAENTAMPALATPTPAKPYIAAHGVSAITLLTAVDGAGAKPLFKWEPVTGAVRYQLIVYDADKTPYWAWEGTESQIYLGGSDQQPPADSEGPVLDGPATWVVFAFDAKGKLIGSSQVQVLNP